MVTEPNPSVCTLGYSLSPPLGGFSDIEPVWPSTGERGSTELAEVAWQEERRLFEAWMGSDGTIYLRLKTVPGHFWHLSSPVPWNPGAAGATEKFLKLFTRS
jgi:hypothetical protein